jgi:hypothetical protein
MTGLEAGMYSRGAVNEPIRNGDVGHMALYRESVSGDRYHQSMSDDEDALPIEDGSGDATAGEGNGARRKRISRLFPALSFKEALFIAQSIQTHGAGQPIRRLTLFESLDRSPDSGPTRKLITASAQYKLTTGGYSAETLTLTQDGAIASSPTAAPRAQLDARLRLAISGIPPFKFIQEKYQGNRLPTVEVLRDAAREAGVDRSQTPECVEIFLANARDLGLVRNIGGSEHLISFEAALEKVTVDGVGGTEDEPSQEEMGLASSIAVVPPLRVSKPRTSTGGDLSDVCFVISPIGGPESVERKHADLVLSSLIEPALAELGLRAVRADGISKPGLITGQVMDHVARAKLVIADLSFGNPNVYYELALRHATKKPVVQIIRSADRLPFDVGQYRTVQVDMTDIYTLVPQLELHRQEITRQCRSAIEEGQAADSPLSQFYPSFWGEIAQ